MLFRQITGLLQLNSNPYAPKAGGQLRLSHSGSYAQGGIRLFTGAIAAAWTGASVDCGVALALPAVATTAAGIRTFAPNTEYAAIRGRILGGAPDYPFNMGGAGAASAYEDGRIVLQWIFGTFTTLNYRRRRGQSPTERVSSG